MDNKVKIFGYGSLINIRSLKKTVPHVESITPVILENYIRVFDTESTTRFTKDNRPICVLNIKENPNRFINGVCFDVSKKDFDSLLEREGAYEVKEVMVKAFTGKEEFAAFVFIGKINKKQNFLFNDPAQIDYLQICLNGAKDFGEDFYKMFLETTLINNKKLTEIKEIDHLL